MKTPHSWLLMMLCHLAFSGAALGYAVGPAPTLDKLAEDSDFIFKGEVIASEPVQDEWFKPLSGYEARETRFKIISPIKGEVGGREVRFRHYDEKTNGLGIGHSYSPQFYHFELGRIYIVVANRTDTGTRQIRPDHTSKMDLGVLRCRDQRPVTAKTLPEIYWAELLALRDSPLPDDVVYAIQQMDGMSESPGGRWPEGTNDFARTEVLSTIRRLISRPETGIAQAAIVVIGDGSPYLSDDRAPYWLGTVGVENPGLAKFAPETRNVGGALDWRELVTVANSKAAPETRALAIRAMGLMKNSNIHQKFMRPWLEAPEVPVRAAAVMLLSDFAIPCDYITGQFAEFATDPAPEVRKCAAYAIGFMQNPDIVPVLSKLIKDEDRDVRRAAGESLRSFHAEIPTVAAALKEDLTNPESQPLSLLAMARQDPGAHLEELAQVIEKKTNPSNWSGGQIPADIRSGKWDRFLDALEKVGQYSSSEPRDIYAFYLQREMPERAAKYRTAAKNAVTYDMDYFFDMVDKSPSTYQGN